MEENENKEKKSPEIDLPKVEKSNDKTSEIRQEKEIKPMPLIDPNAIRKL